MIAWLSFGQLLLLLKYNINFAAKETQKHLFVPHLPKILPDQSAILACEGCLYTSKSFLLVFIFCSCA